MSRRAQAAALAALAALALLLLAALPPPPPPARPARPQPPAPVALTHTQIKNQTETTTEPPDRGKPTEQEKPVQNEPNKITKTENTEKSSIPDKPEKVEKSEKPPVSSSPVARPSGPQPVLVKDVYIAGHSQPHPELCPSLGTHLKLMILITSAPSHDKARDAIRLTWGHYASRKDISLAFFLGKPPDSLVPALNQEDELYGDIVIGNSIDSYSNLTLKTISMLEWIDTYCPRVPRILKTDDDMFINIPKLTKLLDARVNASKTIWGKVVKKWLPKRTTKSKYYVSPLQYPPKVFPDFATGPAYVLTADSISPLLTTATKERYVRLEDVFLTGVVASKAKIARKHVPEFLNRQVVPHACALRRAVSLHMVRPHEQLELWRKLLDERTRCPS